MGTDPDPANLPHLLALAVPDGTGAAYPAALAQIAPVGIAWSAVLISCLILLNAFFAMAEIALVSVRKTRIRQLIEEGVPSAVTVQRLMENPTRLLATVQIGVTLVGFFASAAGAVTLAQPVADVLARTGIPFVARNSLGVAVFVVTLVIGYLSLVIGEISPKSLALQHSEKIALRSAKFLLFLSIVLAPLVRVVTWSSNIIVRPFGGKASFSSPVVTEEELKMLVEAGEEDGIIEEEEREMIHSIFEFTDTVVRKVMVPRIDMKTVDVESPIAELLDVIMEEGHSRIPIYEEDVDHIVGIVHAKDLLRVLHEKCGADTSIRDLMRPPYIIPENKKVDELLAEFKKSKIQLAIVVDEYGGTAGLVTIEDLLEEIVGDIMDEYDEEEPLVEVIDANTSIVDARTPIDEINEQMDLQLPEEEFDTIGGFVFGLFGKQPHLGESVEYDGAELTIAETDGPRINKVKIVKTGRPDMDAAEVDSRD
ncbi:MAG: HlyC/CorC family transporter [Armatimonadetes bacterium]|nr:HlyC/CorC family transporter [Armatimonadota bacterium]